MNGRGEAMEEWLYTHQPTLTAAVVRQAAHEVGGVNDFDAKYASTLALVKGDVEFGKQLNIKSTPTFFVDGVRVEGVMRPELFDQAIAYELKRAADKPDQQ
jgi:protein-disulfide isomerase